MTITEIRVLQTLWTKKRPMCASEIVEENPDIKEITLRTSLKKMQEKELIKVAGMTQRTKNFARTFVPNVTQEDVYHDEIVKASGANPFKFVCSLLKNSTLSDEQCDILKSIIDERSKK